MSGRWKCPFAFVPQEEYGNFSAFCTQIETKIAEKIPGVEPKGRRLYSREQVIFLLTAVEVYRLNEHKEADWTGFKKHTTTQWPV